MWFVYNLLTSTIVWTILVPWHFVQISRGVFSRNLLRGRLGTSPVPRKLASKRILIHAVSVGEVSCIEPLLISLQKEISDFEVIITTGTKDGIAVAESLQRQHPAITAVMYLPWDRSRAMNSWLQKMRPDLVATVEVELWPNLFWACRQLNIPLYIVSGRLYSNDVWRYRLAKHFFRDVLSCVEWIGVQSEQEHNRFLKIGASPETLHIVGNLKNDMTIPPQQLPRGGAEYLIEHNDLIIIGGSTHNPEEKLLLQAFIQLRNSFSRLRLVLAPRNIRRCSSIERHIVRLGLIPLRSSCMNIGLESWDVLLLDSMGLLAPMYARADIVVMGGSFVNHGGHNFLEPASLGRSVIIGPHTQNFQEGVELFSRSQAILQLNHVQELAPALHSLLSDSTRRNQIGENARSLFHSQQGAASRYAHSIHQRLKNEAAACT